jgi:bacillithiol synthase
MLEVMSCSSIPYSRVPNTSALLIDYLYHFDRVNTYYTASPFEFANYLGLAEAITSRNFPRREMAEILQRQNQDLGGSAATLANIDKLDSPGTVAVVTGQQVGLFSGPAFTFYKAATAIRLTQWLNEQGLGAVPVFWLATEDHDLAEVASADVFASDFELLNVTDPGERPAPQSSVGYVRLTAAMNEALATLEQNLPQGESRDWLVQQLRECYQPGEKWGRAFGRFLARFLSRWGVVLLDPLDPAIHELARPVYSRALHDATALRERIRERSNALVKAGYHAQVHVADDSTLLFVEEQGNRLALHERGGRFHAGDGPAMELAELEARLDSNPLAFTSNVMLRPIAQDTLLPTLTYVGGPAEVAYFGQNNPIYSEFGRPMPLIFPRAGFTVVDRRIRRLLGKYRLSIEDVWKGEQHLSEKIVAAGFLEGWADRLDQSEKDLAAVLVRLRDDIEKIDPTLLDTLKHAEEKIAYQMERLRGKITRSALQRSELLVRHAHELSRFIFPRKELQERQVSGIYFLAALGQTFLDRLIDQIQVTGSDHQVIDE